MPGYFDVLSCRYGVDNLFAEYHHILDLAFVAANWRYTMIVTKNVYRCGIAEWPPTDSKWSGALVVAPCVAPGAPIAGAAATTGASSQASAPSQGACPGAHAQPGEAVPAAAESGHASVGPEAAAQG